jgi:hypothetical protein
MPRHCTALLHRHPSLVAWLVGHRHLHEDPAAPGAAAGGFWEISTGAVIDWPVQTRAVEFQRHADDAVGDPLHAAATTTRLQVACGLALPLGPSFRRRPRRPHAGRAGDGDAVLVCPR